MSEHVLSGPIVVGIDGSADGDAAVDLAASIAESTGRQLVVVFVRHLPAIVEASSALGEANAALDDLASHLRETLENKFAERNLQWSFETRQGDPSSQIMGLADDIDAGMIVVGHRGHNQAISLLLGSVATRLVHQAHQPVLVAR